MSNRSDFFFPLKIPTPPTYTLSISGKAQLLLPHPSAGVIFPGMIPPLPLSGTDLPSQPCDTILVHQVHF